MRTRVICWNIQNGTLNAIQAAQPFLVQLLNGGGADPEKPGEFVIFVLEGQVANGLVHAQSLATDIGTALGIACGYDSVLCGGNQHTAESIHVIYSANLQIQSHVPLLSAWSIEARRLTLEWFDAVLGRDMNSLQRQVTNYIPRNTGLGGVRSPGLGGRYEPYPLGGRTRRSSPSTPTLSRILQGNRNVIANSLRLGNEAGIFTNGEYTLRLIEYDALENENNFGRACGDFQLDLRHYTARRASWLRFPVTFTVQAIGVPAAIGPATFTIFHAPRPDVMRNFGTPSSLHLLRDFLSNKLASYKADLILGDLNVSDHYAINGYRDLDINPVGSHTCGASRLDRIYRRNAVMPQRNLQIGTVAAPAPAGATDDSYHIWPLPGVALPVELDHRAIYTDYSI